jgi:hypothetical protein
VDGLPRIVVTDPGGTSVLASALPLSVGPGSLASDCGLVSPGLVGHDLGVTGCPSPDTELPVIDRQVLVEV